MLEFKREQIAREIMPCHLSACIYSTNKSKITNPPLPFSVIKCLLSLRLKLNCLALWYFYAFVRVFLRRKTWVFPKPVDQKMKKRRKKKKGGHNGT